MCPMEQDVVNAMEQVLKLMEDLNKSDLLLFSAISTNVIWQRKRS